MLSWSQGTGCGRKDNGMRNRNAYLSASLIIALACALLAPAQNLDVAQKLEGFDEYMAKVLKDWNGPGIGVGIVTRDKLVFAKGYGYRDYEKMLSFTPGTVCPIASNTKLFTAIRGGSPPLSLDSPILGRKRSSGAAHGARDVQPLGDRKQPMVRIARAGEERRGLQGVTDGSGSRKGE
jgi:beta-lactamase family protein